MRKLIVCFISMLMSVAANAVPARVDYIFDGDTFSAQIMLEPDIEVTVRVRLLNVDTPEIKGQCQAEKIMAKNARDYLSTLLPRGTIVELDNIKDDKYLGRINANVFLPDGREVGLMLIDAGVGRPYGGGKRAPWCEK
jgi:endonuclease YncB( thermonuclease family)